MQKDYYLYMPTMKINNSLILDSLSENIQNCTKKEMTFDEEFSPVNFNYIEIKYFKIIKNNQNIKI